MQNRSKIIPHLFSLLIVCLTGALLLFIPSLNNENLMNGTQSGKTFAFLYGIIGVGTLTFVRFIFLKNYRNLKISFLDILFSVWILYIIINGLFKGIPFSLRILDLAGLVVFYIVIRQIQRKYYPFLFVALVFGGLFQAFYGNLQLWGYYPSHHGLFRMTGSFFNPGPYAGYLASVFPVALGAYLFKLRILYPEQKKTINQQINRIKINIIRLIRKGSKYSSKHTNSPKEPLMEKQQVKAEFNNSTGVLFALVIIAILLVIPASRSRASWLAVIASFCFLVLIKYKSSLYDLYSRVFSTILKKTISSVLIILFATASLWGLYHLKKDSADGRLLIWKVTAEMIQDYPLTGVGFDRFKAHYMDYQAGYFQQNPDSVEAMVAGDTNYAFNEFFQLTAENGFLGLLIILLSLFITFSNVFSKPNKTSEKESNTNRLIIIAKAGMISIIIFGLFAYPVQILPIKMSFVLFLATVPSFKNSIIKYRKIYTVKNNRKLVTVLAKVVLIICIAFGATCTINRLIAFTNAYKSWNRAFQLYQVGMYEVCLENYKDAHYVLSENGDFLTNYGKALSMAGKFSHALGILQKATEIYPNIVVYTALGDSNKNLYRLEEAEEAYFHACLMNPSKFYSKYLLAKLYNETGQTKKAIVIAQELLVKEAKVESSAVEEIRNEMFKILDK